MSEQISIVDWIDFDNQDHLKALDSLITIGVWPGNFLPTNVYFPSSWLQGIAYKAMKVIIKERMK